MAEPGDILDPDDEFSRKPRPWGIIIGVIVFIGLGILTFWLTREKKNEEARKAVLTILDQELETQQEAIKAQRQKVMDLTRQVETLRSEIQSGQVKGGKAAVAQFNQLAAEQRAERDKFAQMADDYNKKVAKYRDIQE